MDNTNPNTENNQSGIKSKLKSPIFIVILILLLSSCCCCGGIGIFSGNKEDNESSSVSDVSSESSVAETTEDVAEELTTETTTEITTTSTTTATTTAETTTSTTETTTVFTTIETTTIETTKSTTEIKEKLANSDEIITLLETILDDKGFEYKIDYYEDANMYSICLWRDGLASEIELGLSSVSKLEEPLIEMSNSISELVRGLDPDVWGVMLSIVDDRDEDTLLIGALDGEIYFTLDDFS